VVAKALERQAEHQKGKQSIGHTFPLCPLSERRTCDLFAGMRESFLARFKGIDQH
jgi:hypothetical protein